jgi:ATP-binding cassette subfamily B protein
MLKIMKYLKSSWWMLILVLIFFAASGVAELYIPDYLAKAQVGATGMLGTGADADFNKVLINGGWALLMTFGTIIATIIGGFLSSIVAGRFSKELRKEVYKKVLSLSTEEFEKFGGASLITRSTNDINQVQNTVFIMFRFLIMAPIFLIGGIVFTLKQNVSLTVVVLVAVSVMIVFFAIVAALIIPLYKKIQTNLDSLTLRTKEGVNGIRVVRAYNSEEVEAAKFEIANENINKVSKKTNQIMAFMWPMVTFLFMITNLLVLYFGARSATGSPAGEFGIQMASVMAVTQYAIKIMMSIMFFTMLFFFVPRASVSAKRINEILDIKPTIVDPQVEKPFEETNTVLEFKNVNFAFDGASEHMLTNVNFKLNIGETVAIIGGTGAGKSTVLNLIPRFYEATEGEINFLGVNVKDVKQTSLRDNIALVPQQPTLFSGSIRDNIKFGKQDATDEEINHAINIAEAKNFVEEAEGGLDHFLARAGTNLSGGQKQRLAIARAIVRKPKLYVFDDSFSALDFKTDANLRKKLKDETKDAAVLIVAQRVATIESADRILVLEKGEIVGEGKHNELLKSCKAYKEIVESQKKDENK